MWEGGTVHRDVIFWFSRFRKGERRATPRLLLVAQEGLLPLCGRVPRDLFGQEEKEFREGHSCFTRISAVLRKSPLLAFVYFN